MKPVKLKTILSTKKTTKQNKINIYNSLDINKTSDKFT